MVESDEPVLSVKAAIIPSTTSTRTRDLHPDIILEQAKHVERQLNELVVRATMTDVVRLSSSQAESRDHCVTGVELPDPSMRMLAFRT
jgi:hypothetical protein